MQPGRIAGNDLRVIAASGVAPSWQFSRLILNAT